jgi:DNA-binding LacI/PurR family transcriptional regulator
LSGIVAAATDRGQDVLLLRADAAFTANGKHLSLFRGGAVDGMLIWGAVRGDAGYIRALRGEGWPVVPMNGFVGDEAAPHLLVDNRRGAFEVAQYVLGLGHRRVAILAGPASARAAVERRDGAVAACRAAGVECRVYPGEFSFESGHNRTQRLLRGKWRPTALLCTNDRTALGAIEAALETGLRVPTDLSVAGADDAFPYYRPRLTTFRAPMYEMGMLGVRLLLDCLEWPARWNELKTANGHIFGAELKPGATTVPPPGGRHAGRWWRGTSGTAAECPRAVPARDLRPGTGRRTPLRRGTRRATVRSVAS